MSNIELINKFKTFHRIKDSIDEKLIGKDGKLFVRTNGELKASSYRYKGKKIISILNMR